MSISVPVDLLLPLMLAAVAFLYASVGHAGASGYIAVLSLAGWSVTTIKPLALVLNSLVAAIGCWNFLRAGHGPGWRIWPLYAAALPAALLGGAQNLPLPWLQRLIGLVLLASAWRLGQQLRDPDQLRPLKALPLVISGAGIGLLAGLTGTGGGVLLTPLLLLCRWCSTRQAAAVSVLFILINSLAGLLGLTLAQPAALAPLSDPTLLLWLLPILPAAALGSRLGSRHWPVATIQRVLAVVLCLAALKLLAGH